MAAGLILGVLAGAGSASARVPAPDQDPAVAPVATADVPARDLFDLLDEYLFGRRVEPQLELTPRTGLQWAFVPTFSYNPVYGGAFGALVSGAGKRGREGHRYSSLAISGNYSTKQQLQLQVRGDVFSPGESYLLKADVRYLDTRRSTWGLGSVDDQQGEYPMSFVLSRAYASLLRRVSGPVFVGAGFHVDVFSDIVDDRAEDGETTPFVLYSEGAPSTTRALGISLNLLADTRDNLVDPLSGYYLNASFRNYLTSIGSDRNWQDLLIEARVYPHFPPDSDNVLGFWLSSWMSFGPAPYLDLPSNGWDTYGRGARGYLAGRIRGSSQLYLESEYRWSLTRDDLLGAVVFVNGTSTTSPSTGTFGSLDPGLGLGLRLKFNKHSSTNLTLDYAWGRQDSRGLFMGMTEVF